MPPISQTMVRSPSYGPEALRARARHVDVHEVRRQGREREERRAPPAQAERHHHRPRVRGARHRGADQAQRHEPERRQRQPEEHRHARGAGRAGESRVIGEHQQPRHLIAGHDVQAARDVGSRRRARRPHRPFGAQAGEGEHDARDRHHRHGHPIHQCGEVGTAEHDDRRQQAEIVAQTPTVPTPVSLDAIEAAMTLFSAIQAKLVTNRTSASAWAPDMPSGARAATIDGTRRRVPIGARTAVSAAPPSRRCR